MKIDCIKEDELYFFQWDFIDSNMYILIHEDNALVIDPNDGEKGKEFLLSQQIKQVMVIPTHEHFDHINGIEWLRQDFDCTVIASKLCSEGMAVPSKNLSNRSDVLVSFNQRLASEKNLRAVEPFTCEADVIFEKRYVMQWFHHRIEIVETPGHSKGSVCIILDDECIFTGDTFLADYETITRLPGGSKALFTKETIPWFKELSCLKMVYPGHGSFVEASKFVIY